jgi:hypothetical protein
MRFVVGVEGIEGEFSLGVVPPRIAPVLPLLAELSRRTRSRSAFSMEGVGELR